MVSENESRQFNEAANEFIANNADLEGPRWASTKRGYALSQSLRQLSRHRLASLVTLLVLGITLTLPALLYFVSPTLQALSNRSLNGESLTVYLGTDIDENQGRALTTQWALLDGVAKAEYVSSETALNLMRENTDLAAAIDALGSNPLPGAIIIYPKESMLAAEPFARLAASFDARPEVDRVQLDHQWIKRLRAVVSLIQWVGGLMAAFLIITALFVITNTIRLETSRRRSEMQVANLLGASGSFIKRPILYSGVLYGLIGGIVACIFALIALKFVQAPADALSSMYNSAVLLKMPSASHYLIVIGVSIALGVIGALATAFQPGNQLTLPDQDTL